MHSTDFQQKGQQDKNEIGGRRYCRGNTDEGNFLLAGHLPGNHDLYPIFDIIENMIGKCMFKWKVNCLQPKLKRI